MRVIIQDQFYEFQNERTEDIFNEQKKYLAQVVAQGHDNEDLEYLITALLSLNNLTEALICQAVEEHSIGKVVETINAKPL